MDLCWELSITTESSDVRDPVVKLVSCFAFPTLGKGLILLDKINGSGWLIKQFLGLPKCANLVIMV